MAYSATTVMTAPANPTQLVGHLQKGIFNSQTDFCLSPSHLLICPNKPTYPKTWKQMPLEFHACAFSQYNICLKMYYMRHMSHQLQKHTSDVHSDLVLRDLLARHNWAKLKESVPGTFWARLSVMDQQHFLAMATGIHLLQKCWLTGHGKTSALGACSLKWSQSKVKSWEGAFDQVPKGWFALKSLTVHESHGPWTRLADI